MLRFISQISETTFVIVRSLVSKPERETMLAILDADGNKKVTLLGSGNIFLREQNGNSSLVARSGERHLTESAARGGQVELPEWLDYLQNIKSRQAPTTFTQFISFIEARATEAAKVAEGTKTGATEALSVENELTEEEKVQGMKVFESLDSDGNGSLDYEELGAIVSSGDRQAMLSALDADGNKKVSLSEWLLYLSKKKKEIGEETFGRYFAYIQGGADKTVKVTPEKREKKKKNTAKETLSPPSAPPSTPLQGVVAAAAPPTAEEVAKEQALAAEANARQQAIAVQEKAEAARQEALDKEAALAKEAALEAANAA